MIFQTNSVPTNWLKKVVETNRSGKPTGLYSVCSAHPVVLRTAMCHALDSGAMLSVESTSNQVNQFGGYTGMTPEDFVAFLVSLAKGVGLKPERILVGSDHLGPYPWRKEASTTSMEKACSLARSTVLAGYKKIHLDASMACGGDPETLDDRTIANRAAEICSVAEAAHRERPTDSSPPLYVIGTEVPVPGGEGSGASGPRPTTVEHVGRTLDSFRKAFFERGLQGAWERVIGLVVQSGAEFGDSGIFDYDPKKTGLLREHLPDSPPLVYEAHSTDYQLPSSLKRMVEDHFAILKVGPWLTFAYREAIFALSALESDWLAGRRGVQLSSVRNALETAMVRNPEHWKAYFAESDVVQEAFSRKFSYSDRCRYYWPHAAVQEEVDLLLHNLSAEPIPLTLVSQYFPQQYGAVRAGELRAHPAEMIEQHIRKVLGIYTNACCTAPVA